MENIGYYEKNSGTRSGGYWLETPYIIYSNMTLLVHGSGRCVTNGESNNTLYFGVRPVITVKTSDLG